MRKYKKSYFNEYQLIDIIQGTLFNFYYSIGDFCKAKECLYRQIINDDYLNGVFNSTAKECKDTRPFFISKYQKYFEALEITVDFNKIDELIVKK